jgi:hypothetical protein
MKRPEFVTLDDIALWNAEIDADPYLAAPLKNDPVFREIGYAGLWLERELTKLGCTPDIIFCIKYAAGGGCFGRDIWEVHQYYLEAYKNDELEFADDPTTQTLQS